jgi:two-component system osmolarity sensor histidine kinase EnvZ
MTFAWLKRFTPRSLYGRAALILLVPVLTIQLVVSVVFIQRHFEDVTRQMTRALALEINLMADRVAAAPSVEVAKASLVPLAGPLGLEVVLPVGPESGDFRRFYDLSGRQMIQTLHARVPGVTAIDVVGDWRAVRMVIETRHGPMQVSFPRARVTASNPHQLLVLMVVTSALMTLIAFIFLRNQLRPITRLARAADAFGKGRVVPYRPAGAVEVRLAGAAFLDMRSRIERQIEQRTLMLSGVSHDLRTPLTRLKLGLSLLDEADTAELLDDVAEMERLIDEFLTFARSDALDDPVPTDPADLVARAIADAGRDGSDVRLVASEGQGEVVMRPVAVGRAIANLIGNALRYGQRAEVSLAIGERSVKVTVEDDGPGIPAERRDEALRPFTRLDQARNQNRGSGVGLGLSIAQDIARRHGGTLRLGDSERLGGLKAELILAR